MVRIGHWSRADRYRVGRAVVGGRGSGAASNFVGPVQIDLDTEHHDDVIANALTDYDGGCHEGARCDQYSVVESAW